MKVFLAAASAIVPGCATDAVEAISDEAVRQPLYLEDSITLESGKKLGIEIVVIYDLRGSEDIIGGLGGFDKMESWHVGLLETVFEFRSEFEKFDWNNANDGILPRENFSISQEKKILKYYSWVHDCPLDADCFEPHPDVVAAVELNSPCLDRGFLVGIVGYRNFTRVSDGTLYDIAIGGPLTVSEESVVIVRFYDPAPPHPLANLMISPLEQREIWSRMDELVGKSVCSLSE